MFPPFMALVTWGVRGAAVHRHKGSNRRLDGGINRVHLARSIDHGVLLLFGHNHE